MKKALVLLVAASAIGVPAVASHATYYIPPPVVVASFSCPANYREVVRAGSTVVCLSNIRPPSVRVTTTGCNADEQAYLVDARYGVCTK